MIDHLTNRKIQLFAHIKKTNNIFKKKTNNVLEINSK